MLRRWRGAAYHAVGGTGQVAGGVGETPRNASAGGSTAPTWGAAKVQVRGEASCCWHGNTLGSMCVCLMGCFWGAGHLQAAAQGQLSCSLPAHRKSPAAAAFQASTGEGGAAPPTSAVRSARRLLQCVPPLYTAEQQPTPCAVGRVRRVAERCQVQGEPAPASTTSGQQHGGHAEVQVLGAVHGSNRHCEAEGGAGPPLPAAAKCASAVLHVQYPQSRQAPLARLRSAPDRLRRRGRSHSFEQGAAHQVSAALTALLGPAHLRQATGCMLPCSLATSSQAV